MQTIQILLKSHICGYKYSSNSWNVHLIFDHIFTHNIQDICLKRNENETSLFIIFKQKLFTLYTREKNPDFFLL